MNSELSAYLNMLRVFAGLAVFAGHVCIWTTNCGFAGNLPYLGNDGVVIFFVLSGYVIAYTAATKDKTFKHYAINRCARIYSVAVPALLLTIGLELIGVAFYPDSYNSIFDHYQFAKIGLYIPLWLSFSSEFWGLNEPVLTNGPFWSLCFEVWFYIFFAAAQFLRGRGRVIAIVAIAGIVGPKICILFPLWLLGVLAFMFQQRATIASKPAQVLFLLSIATYVCLKIYAIDEAATNAINAALGDWPRSHLQMAWNVPGYFLIALCCAGSILGLRFSNFRFIAAIAYPVGLAASFTFTTYLTHFPLLKFFTTIADTETTPMLWPIILTFVSIIVLAPLTEHRVRPWRAAFNRLFERFVRPG